MPVEVSDDRPELLLPGRIPKLELDSGVAYGDYSVAKLNAYMFNYIPTVEICSGLYYSRVNRIMRQLLPTATSPMSTILNSWQ